MIHPPLCFRVRLTWCFLSSVPGHLHTHFRPSDPYRFILVSSDQTTRFQSSTVQCWYFVANSSLWRICFERNKGFLGFTYDFKPCCFKALRMVSEWIKVPVSRKC